MASKSIKKNYIYNLLQQMLALITPLITIPYISRVIGAEGIGIYSYTSSVVLYFAMFAALGTISYGQREISYVQDNKEKRTQVFWNTEIRCIITTLIVLCTYVPFVLYQEQYRLIYAILTIHIIDVIFNISWFFMGMEEFGTIVRCNVIVRILNLAFIFIFVKDANDLPIYVFGLTVVMLLGNLSLWPFLPKFIGRPKIKEIHPFKDFMVVLSMFVPTIAISIYTVLDKIMIGVLTQNAAENGFYDQSIKMSRMALTFVTALGTVMVPRIGFLFEKKDQQQIKMFMYRSYKFVGLLGIPLCLGIIGTASNFVPWFYGPGFDRVVPILSTLSLIIFAIGISNVTGVQYLVPTQRQNTLTITVLIGAAFNVICNLIFIPNYGALGAAIASVLAEIVIAIVQLFVVRKELSCVTIVKNFIKYLIAGLFMLFILKLIGFHLKPSVLNTFILIFAGSAIYITVLFLLKDEFFITNVKNMKQIVKNKIHSGNG